jgi:thiol-disulfide isomerase/thioredoxin
MKHLLLCLMCCGPLPGWAAEALPPGMLVLDGKPAMDLRLTDADGKRTDLKELGGHWVMVHFWASWCGPCRAEMPSLQRLVESGKAPALKLVLVNTAEGDDEVAAFLSLHAPDLVTLMDRDGQVTERWQPRGLPSSFFVDPEGRLRYLALGGRPWDTLPYLQFLRQLPIPVPGP